MIAFTGMFIRSVIRRDWDLGQAIFHGRAWTQKPQVLYKKKRHQKLLRCGLGRRRNQESICCVSMRT